MGLLADKHNKQTKETRVGDLLRLPNGQCAKIIDIGPNKIIERALEDNSITLKDIPDINWEKTISIIVEDGTIITGLYDKDIENIKNGINTKRSINILNEEEKKTDVYINPNATILNKHHADKDVDKKAKLFFKRQVNKMLNKGFSSDPEMAYNFILSEIGFKTVNSGFLEQFLHKQEKRFPDSVLIKDDKMVFFEYDGEIGHKDIMGNEKIERDKRKNELYKEIINKAKNGEIEGISDVLVLRIRAKNVPMLNPQNNIFEINEYVSKNDVKNVERSLFQMMETMDNNFGWNMSQQLSQLLQKIDIEIPNTTMTVSQLVGFGTKEDKCGPFIAMPQKTNFNLSINDQYNIFGNQVIFTDYNKVYLLTRDKQFNKDFKQGTILLDQGGYPKLYDHAFGSFFTNDEMNIFEIKFDNASMTYEEILEARSLFPQNDKDASIADEVLCNANANYRNDNEYNEKVQKATEEIEI